MVSVPAPRLNWQEPSATGGPSPAELLLQWFETDYVAYSCSSNKEKFLKGLHKTITDAGHDSCRLRAVRSKIESLERQMKGEQNPSKVFKENFSLLKLVFDQAHPNGMKSTAEGGSTAPKLANEDDQSSSDTDDDEKSKTRRLEQDNATLEDEDAFVRELEKQEARARKRAESGSFDAARTSNGDFLVVKRMKHGEVSPRENPFSKGLPISIENNDGGEKDNVRVKPEPQPSGRHEEAPHSFLSTTEIERIATLLRERHGLQEAGVPQDVIDKYLPLPNE